MGREGKWDTALMLFRVQERITKAIYIRRGKGEKFQLGRLSTACENVEKYTGYAEEPIPRGAYGLWTQDTASRACYS